MTESETHLLARYRGLICDLDGVVYRGAQAVPHAVESLSAAGDAGLPVVYATNNASRPPADVAEQLRSLGLRLEVGDVVTSSQAGARHIADRYPAGSRVLAVGGEGVGLALRQVELVPVRPAELAEAHDGPDDGVVAVLQGLGTQVAWTDLAEAAFAVAGGALWVATNADTTLPTQRGLAPGNGALVGCVRHAVGVDPVVVGKPEPPLYLLCADLLEVRPEETLAIGDRLDTDIAGAVSSGIDSLYVATGVSHPRDVGRAGPQERPTYLAVDLRGLHGTYVPGRAEPDADAWVGTCGDARVRCGADGSLRPDGAGTPSQRLRAAVAAAWAAADAGHPPADDEAWDAAQAWIEQGTETP